MDEVLKEVRALRQEVASLRRAMADQMRFAARTLDAMDSVQVGHDGSTYVPGVPLGSRPAGDPGRAVIFRPVGGGQVRLKRPAPTPQQGDGTDGGAVA